MSEFILWEQRKVRDTLEALMMKLGTIIDPEIAQTIAKKEMTPEDKVKYIHEKIMPRYAPLPELNLSLPENECFLVVGNKIAMAELNCPELKEVGQFPKREYSSLLAFNLGEGRYLAAGSLEEIIRGGKLRSRVEIANIGETEELCSIKMERESTDPGEVSSLTLWAPKGAEETLVFSYAHVGVLEIPLLKIDPTTKYLPVDSNSRYWILNAKKEARREVSLVLAKASGQDLYVAIGNEVYHTKKTGKINQNHLYHQFPAAISALDVNSAKDSNEIYLATLSGQIFCGKEEFFRTEKVAEITKMQAGIYEGIAGLFFCGRSGASRSMVYFTEGQGETAVPLPRGYPTDFSVRGNDLWLVSRKGNKSELWMKQEKSLPMKVQELEGKIRMIY